MPENTLQDHELWWHNHWLLSPHNEVLVRISETGHLVLRNTIGDSFTVGDVYSMKAVLA